MDGAGQGLLSEEEVGREDRVGFVDGFCALDSELAFHADKFVKVAEEDGGDLLPDVQMVIFRDEDFLVGDLELGLELFVVQRFIDPMELFHQLDYRVIDFITLNNTVNFIKVRQLVIQVTVFIEFFICYFFLEFEPFADGHVFGVEGE